MDFCVLALLKTVVIKHVLGDILITIMRLCAIVLNYGIQKNLEHKIKDLDFISLGDILTRGISAHIYNKTIYRTLIWFIC